MVHKTRMRKKKRTEKKKKRMARIQVLFLRRSWIVTIEKEVTVTVIVREQDVTTRNYEAMKRSI